MYLIWANSTTESRLGDLIAELRKKHGLSQEKLALEVDNLMPSIWPYAHNGQDDLIHSAHLAPFVAALVGPGRTGGTEHLAPHAIDDQNRRRVGDRACARFPWAIAPQS